MGDHSSKKHNEMLQSFIDKDAQIQDLQKELENEKSKRLELEALLDDLEQSRSIVNDDEIISEQSNHLHEATDQVEILKNLVHDEDDGDVLHMAGGESTSSSFAAMEQLHQSFQNAKQEISTLRQQLFASEQIRTKLQTDLQA